MLLKPDSYVLYLLKSSVEVPLISLSLALVRPRSSINSLYLDSRCRREATDRLGDAQGDKANWADYLV